MLPLNTFLICFCQPTSEGILLEKSVVVEGMSELDDSVVAASVVEGVW